MDFLLINLNPIFIIGACIALGLALLFLFYIIRKKIRFSLGPWNYAIAILIAGAVIIPMILIFEKQYFSISVISGLSVAILLFVIDKKLEKKEKTVIENHKSKFHFYYACVKNGITSLDKEKDIKRAELIAKDYPAAKGVDIKVFFEECKKLAEKAENENAKKVAYEKMQILKNKEQSEYNSRLKYANCIENEKTILSLNNDLDRLLNGYRQDSTFGKRASEHLLEKEKDWAVRGGIANAIAGPAAGLAVAIDTQAKNAEIRKRNANMSAGILQMQMISDSRARAKEEQIEKIKEIIAAEKLKLTQKLSEKDAEKYINVTVDQTEFSETGAFRIKATVEMIKPLIIFEDVNARIDGSFTCVLSQEGKVVGEAKMVLPIYGMLIGKNSKTSVAGICLSGVSADKSYSAEFVLDNIWGVEN